MNRRLKLTCLMGWWVGLAPIVQAVGPDTDGTIPGSNNGEGIGVLVSRTTGVWNTGTGYQALNHLTAGNQNTATGLRALFSDTDGGFNTATGVYSLFSNTSGLYNTATGVYSLRNNSTGSRNTATGYGALYLNTADYNVGNGFAALYNNTTGAFNTANGESALYSNTNGSRNTANGSSALVNNTTGDGNTASGWQALFNNRTGSNNIALGIGAGFNLTGDNNIVIGNFGVAGDANTIRIGGTDTGFGPQTNTYIAGIRGATVASGVTVIVGGDGHLGTLTSSARFKDGIKPIDKASEAILALKPVTFCYKKELDPNGIPQFGLVAEDVEKVNPDLVARDAKGEVYTVRYEAVNAMLLNEFLKEHKKVEAQNRRIQEQDATITQLKKEMETVVAHLKEQDSKIQAVSDQIELRKPAPQLVLSNP